MYDRTSRRRSTESFDIRSGFATFPENAPEKPEIYLLDFLIESNKLGSFRQSVLYVVMENYNFLCEVLLNYQMEVSHVVKVRDGTGFGGNRISVANVNPFFSALKTKYLICDDHADLRLRLVHKLSQYYDLNLKKVILKEVVEINDWSWFFTRVFEVHPTTEPFDDDSLTQFMKQITDLSPRQLRIEEEHRNLRMRRRFG